MKKTWPSPELRHRHRPRKTAKEVPIPSGRPNGRSGGPIEISRRTRYPQLGHEPAGLAAWTWSGPAGVELTCTFVGCQRADRSCPAWYGGDGVPRTHNASSVGDRGNVGPNVEIDDTLTTWRREGEAERRGEETEKKKRKSNFLSPGIRGPRNSRCTRMRVCFFDAGGASLRSVIVTAVSGCCGLCFALCFGGSGWSLRRGAAGVAIRSNDSERSLVDDGILR